MYAATADVLCISTILDDDVQYGVRKPLSKSKAGDTRDFHALPWWRKGFGERERKQRPARRGGNRGIKPWLLRPNATSCRTRRLPGSGLYSYSKRGRIRIATSFSSSPPRAHNCCGHTRRSVLSDGVR
jgi:hypothetical protein